MADPAAFDVIVVGAGPAGVAAAAELRRWGIRKLVVLERDAGVGGATRHCAHPTFGLREFGRLLTGPAYARRLAAYAEALGVDIRLRHSVVSLGPGGRLGIAMPDGRLDLVGKRIVLATGAREETRAGRLVTGDRPLGIMNTGALQSYIQLQRLRPFRRPVVVGTELVGLSALWTCRAQGIAPQMVVDDGSGPIAGWPLGIFPALLGIPVRYGARITDIMGKTRVEAVEITDGTGRVTTIACDGLLLTGRFRPEASLLRQSALALDPGTGGPRIDQRGRCSDPAYAAAGNLLRSIETAGWCFREGQALGGMIADDLLDEVPRSGSSLAIRRGRGVTLTVPQVLTLPLDRKASPPLQLRLANLPPCRLTVTRDGVVVWSRRLRPKPERRVLIPLDALGLSADTRDLLIDVQGGPHSP